MRRTSILSLMLCALGLTATGCTPGRRSAEAELTAARNALDSLNAEAREYTATEVRAIQKTIDSAAAMFERAEYRAALVAAESARARAEGLADTVAVRKSALAASWSILRDSVPAMLQEIEVQVDRLSSARELPTGVSRSQLDSAWKTLQAHNDMWAQAIREFEGGKLATAVMIADSVRVHATQMMRSLGLRSA